MKRLLRRLKQFNSTEKAVGVVAIIAIIGALGGSSNTPTTLNAANASAAKPTTSSTQIQPAAAATVITTSKVTEPQSIPYTSTTVDDPTLPQGQTTVKTTGLNGTETLVYEVTITNGAQTNKVLTDTVINRQPVTQVTAIGTYVAPAPASETDDYSGATAICADGTYSYSQHRSGTCSHHGGVAQWL